MDQIEVVGAGIIPKISAAKTEVVDENTGQVEIISQNP